MDFNLSSEQSQLRDSVRDFLESHYSLESRKAIVSSEAGWSPEIWSAFANELGILSLPLPEEEGGMNGDPFSIMSVMEVLGEFLVVEPFLQTVIAGSLLRRTGGEFARAELERIATGKAVYALGLEVWGSRVPGQSATKAKREGNNWRISGRKSHVVGAPWASRIIVSASTDDSSKETSLFVVDPSTRGVRLHAYRTIDGARAADVVMDDVTLPAHALLGSAGAAYPEVQQISDEAVAGVCAEAVGVMRRLLNDTIAYTSQRRQFGQPLASFQVLRHRMVDMYMQTDHAVSAVYLATSRLGAEPKVRAKAVSGAKALVGRASQFVAQGAVQLHGGMGMTDEVAVGHYFKRAMVIENLFGSNADHVRRYASLNR